MKQLIKLYKPKSGILIMDFISWSLAAFMIFIWRLIAEKMTIWEYLYLFFGLFLAWAVVGYCVGKYQEIERFKHSKAFIKLFITAAITFLVTYLTYKFLLSSLSVYVSCLAVLLATSFNLLLLLGYYAFRYAINTDDIIPTIEARAPAIVLKPNTQRSEKRINEIRTLIEEYSGLQASELLTGKIDIGSTNTIVMAVRQRFNISSLENYRYDCLINLTQLNAIRGINKMFCEVNVKLPDNGRFVCCFQSQEGLKKSVLERYPKGINYVVYTGVFLKRRVLPKLRLTSRIYFDLTGGRKRLFSETEILGRLYYCGFAVDAIERIGNESYVFSHRVKLPEPQSNRVYGAVISLRRVGKKGRVFNFYKMRTMHPYSEYLQAYMYDTHQLQEGGKIKDDIRISTLGAFMRKYWIDELPMLINLLRGDMKLVGVRPLSAHYFSLYSQELQEKRIKYRPGLLPPFYADMPKTLDEIQASELRYLDTCDKRGVIVTDFIYFWKIVGNIVFRKARSK